MQRPWGDCNSIVAIKTKTVQHSRSKTCDDTQLRQMKHAWCPWNLYNMIMPNDDFILCEMVKEK